jgi:hypothetical protein
MKLIKYLGAAIYGFVALASVVLVLIDPTGLDVRPLILPVIVALFVSALGFSYTIASKNQNRVIVFLGTALLAIVFAALAFFVIAGVAWFVAVSHT